MADNSSHHRLCLMLAFQTVVAHSKNSEDLAEKTIELAKRMNEFCDLNLSKAFPIFYAEAKEAPRTETVYNLDAECRLCCLGQALPSFTTSKARTGS